ncbi:MAG: hypothetical protein H6917_14220 [Novosphingobium sp.]|nr:hypothetical protein [Novosphingobium sp.]MCP5403528.1 hypothetical protein [Novosphingobium sp.]
MRKFFLGAAVLVVCWVALLSVPFHYLFETVPPGYGVKPAAHLEESDLAQGSVGGERRDMLVRATKLYVSQHPEAPAAMAQGKEFAPEEFLNDELKREGQKWRVRHVHGTQAQIYDVS